MIKFLKKFTVYGTPVPQGSMKAFLPRGARRPIVTSDNTKLKPFRQQVAQTALAELRGETFARGTPVSLILEFYLERPPSVPKKRAAPCVKPDVDKLARAVADALTDIAYADDAQICELYARKHYGTPARVEIEVGEAGEAVECVKFNS